MTDPDRSELSLNIVAGAVAALVVIGVCAGGGYLVGQRKLVQAKRGWAFEPVALGARDLPAGTVLTEGDVVAGEAPEQFVTSHAVRARERSTLVGKTLLAPLGRGELVNRGHVELVQPPGDLVCAKEADMMARFVGIAGEPSVNAFVERLRSAP